MAPDEIIMEIKELRSELERTVERLFELSKVLYTKARRSDVVDDRTSAFVLYANAWTRFSGMVGQGLRRTASVDRVLRVAQQNERDRQEHERQEQARGVQEAKREAKRENSRASNLSFVPSPGVEDLVALYGQEVVGYASK